MKYYTLLIIFGLLIASCGNGKEIVEDETSDLKKKEETVKEEVEETEAPSTGSGDHVDENHRIIGVVHVNDGECPLWIEAREKDGPIKIFPVGLAEKFQKEGMKIKFAYTRSMAQQPEGCDVDLAAVLSDVTLMR
ncbi:MAG: hypothetical protein ACPG21_14330 [Crocinitomicaceae bacterium]